MFLTLEQRLMSAKVLFVLQIVLSVGLSIALLVSLERIVQDSGGAIAGGQNLALAFGALAMPFFIAIGVAVIALHAMRKRTRNWMLIAAALLVLEIVGVLTSGGYPVFVGLALLLLLRRDVLEHLNAWPKKST